MFSWSALTTSHLFASTLAVLVYILGSRAARERRAPAGAVAWVLSLLLVPWLALPLYLSFGRRKLPRLPRHRAAPAPGAVASWAQALTAAFELEPAAPATVRFHADGRAARQALLDTIDAARARLDLCSFIIARDGIGHEVMQRLRARAEAGVHVRVLVDGLSIALLPWADIRRLREAGGEVELFRPLTRLRSDAPRNLRNHRKLTIADGARLWSGGRNVADEYFLGRAGEAPWIDLSFDLEGAVAAAAARRFDADWLAATRRGAPPLAPPAEPAHGRLAQFLPSGPDQLEDTAHALIVAGCWHARRRILAVTPYFVPDDGLLTALRLAARRGVDVHLVIPSRSNHRLADFARHRALRQLAAAGATVSLVDAMVHAKALVFDDRLALCGSFNLDPRSLLLNHEAGVVFHDSDDIAWLAGWIEALARDRARGYVADRPGVLRDTAEGLVTTLAFQL